MKRIVVFAIPIILAAVPWPCLGGEPVVKTFPFDSKWESGARGNGAAFARAGRTETGIVIEGSGSGLLGESLSYTYATQTAEFFDRSITARLTSFDGQDGGSAGIALREYLEVGGFEIFMDIVYTPDGKLHRQGWTWDSGVVPDPVVIENVSLPVWLQVEYTGGGLFTKWSEDGVTWQPIGDLIPGTLPDTVSPTLIVSSGEGNGPACAYFENIWISGGDADDNGILDGWEMKHFGRTLGADLPEQDLDGDLITIRDEWLTGRNPFEQEEPVRMQIAKGEDGQLEVRVADTYVCWHLQSAGSPAGPWESIREFFGPRTHSIQGDEVRRFFRAIFLGREVIHFLLICSHPLEARSSLLNSS